MGFFSKVGGFLAATAAVPGAIVLNTGAAVGAVFGNEKCQKFLDEESILGEVYDDVSGIKDKEKAIKESIKLSEESLKNKEKEKIKLECELEK